MPEFRRGGAAIQEATENTGSGEFTPFLPNLYWKNDKEAKYVLFLNTAEDFVTADMIHFIPADGHFESVVAKTEPAIGETHDAFVEKWQAPVKTTTLGVAVELEPVMEKVGQRTKPTGFTVATRDFTRKVYDDDGNATDEEEEVTTPVIGLVSQSPHNFFNHVSEWDATESPVHETPLKITRSGDKKNVSYNVAGYDVLVDLDPLFEYLGGVTYIGDEEAIDALSEEISGQEPYEAAVTIGNFLLNKRLDEFIDDDRYDELLAGVTETMAYGGKKKDKKEGRKATNRVARPSQRRQAQAEEAEAEDAPEPEPEETEEPKATKAKGKTSKAKRAPSKGDSPQDRLAALRAKAESKAS